MLRAEAAIGAVIRDALARAGVNPAHAARLGLADEAAAELAALPDMLASRRAASGRASDPDPFEARILALVRGFADGHPPDFAGASFAELFAWSLARSSSAPTS